MVTTQNTILITGGTLGIGKELVNRFYALGNKIIVAASNVSHLEKLKSDFPRIDVITCNLADEAAVQNLIDTCILKHNSINIIINNAGVQYNYLWAEEKNGKEKIASEIMINYTSPMQLIYGLLPVLTSKKNAAIVNVSSALAYTPKQTAPVYCGTKAAMHIATKALRYQFESAGIKVFELIPPLVNTAMTAGRGKGKISPKQLADKFMAAFKNDIYEINVGKARLLKLIQRISPGLADHIMKNAL